MNLIFRTVVNKKSQGYLPTSAGRFQNSRLFCKDNGYDLSCVVHDLVKGGMASVRNILVAQGKTPKQTFVHV